MAKLYYGKGQCNIEGSQIKGVQIHYSGKARVEKTANDHFVLMNKNNIIMIFPVLKHDHFLSSLFIYNGKIKINQIIVSGVEGSKISCSIHRMMDYTELLTSNSEDMTTNSEDLNAGYANKQTIKESHIISNLHTDSNIQNIGIKYDDVYEGPYHIHIKDTPVSKRGAYHTSSSVPLYFMKNGKIVNKIIKKTTNKARRTSTKTGGSKGGSY